MNIRSELDGSGVEEVPLETRVLASSKKRLERRIGKEGAAAQHVKHPKTSLAFLDFRLRPPCLRVPAPNGR